MEEITFTSKDVLNIFSWRNFKEIVDTFLYNIDKMLTKNANYDTDTMLIIAFFAKNWVWKYMYMRFRKEIWEI